MECKTSTRRLVSTTPFIYSCCCFLSTCLFCICLLLLCCCCSTSTTPTTVRLDIRSPFVKETSSYIQIQGIERWDMLHMERKDEKQQQVTTTRGSRSSSTRPLRNRRRYLNGLGSFPPRCKSKCGNCTPCKPVHVPVPPGTSAPTEYYPEAWRCKCKNKLYMP